VSAVPDRDACWPRPSVIVLTYRSAETLPACLAALRPQVERLDGELLVVDNASPDGSVAVARQLGLEVIETGANLGFAGGCNVGASKASGDLFVFVNPDAVVDDDALAALVDVAGDMPLAGPLGGRAHHPDGSYDRRSVLGRPSLRGALLFGLGISTFGRGSRLFDPEHGPLDVPAYGRPVPVQALSGAMLAVPRELWDLLGGFDERFFLYGEDVDLSVRAAAAGWQPTLVPAAGYTHVGGGSSSPSDGPRLLLYRGKVELYRRYLPAGLFRLALLALQLGTFLRGVPAAVPLPGVAYRARPWWELYRCRRSWRLGYRDHVPGTVPQ
jgi:N-acetylglucosaminyl-diphospho-decaprenol L-rhamnosyltransferase